MEHKRIKNLFSLLDDQSDTVAYGAMVELLKYPEQLDSFLSEYHESPDHLMRKRIHQLDAIMTIRRRRKNFMHALNRSEINLAECLAEIHLMWYDNDSKPMLTELLDEFTGAAETFEVSDIFRLGDFMRKNNFATPIDGETLNPDNYCVGSVIDDRCGSEIMLCLLALLASFTGGYELRIAYMLDHFLLIDKLGNWLMPSGNWKTGKLASGGKPEYWDDGRQILKYLALQLFASAVGSDSFRYIHTIAAALTGSDGTNMDDDLLPYPYRPLKDGELRK